MGSVTASWKPVVGYVSPSPSSSSSSTNLKARANTKTNTSSSISQFPFSLTSRKPSSLNSRPSYVLRAKKRARDSSSYSSSSSSSSSSLPDPLLKPTIIEEVALDNHDEEDDPLLFDGFNDETLDGDEDEFLEDEYLEDEAELYVGDGGGGGGISLAGTWWDKEALAIAEKVCQSFDGDLNIYAFKTLSNCTIQVRIEKMSNRSGSPTMEDIEGFSMTYRARLDEAEAAKSIPDNLSLEVSSPGVERVVRVPQDFERFKDRAMYVKYVNEVGGGALSAESDGIFKLVSFDIESKTCTWGVADVRVNREKAGKGRPLSKKQREWRLNTSFDSLRLVRLYSEA